MRPVIVFDVESIGLHGEAFAVGAVVIDLERENNNVLEKFQAAINPAEHCSGAFDDIQWVVDNVPHLPATHKTPIEMRTAFWNFWRKWANRSDCDVYLMADCAWPVETNFLAAVIADDPVDRKWQGPYPLLDLSTILWTKGYNPKGNFGRIPDELPEHDPLADARQSARVLTGVNATFGLTFGKPVPSRQVISPST